MTERGAVFAEDAYALGKMLDHSNWQSEAFMPLVLPRNITPSDIDMVFDNAGAIIFCELSADKSDWRELTNGQRRTYENAIRGTANIAVVCRHSVKPEIGRKINTRTDINAFQVMLHQAERFILTKSFQGNNRWQKFVVHWHNAPASCRETLVSFCKEYGMTQSRTRAEVQQRRGQGDAAGATSISLASSQTTEEGPAVGE